MELKDIFLMRILGISWAQFWDGLETIWGQFGQHRNSLGIVRMQFGEHLGIVGGALGNSLGIV